MTRLEAARHLGVSIATVDRLTASGYMPKPSESTPEEISTAYHAYQRAIEPTHDLSQERAKLAIAQRERIELDLAQKRGQLVDVTKAMWAWGKTVESARARFIGFPHKVAPLIYSAASIEECRQILEEHVREVLLELANPDLSEVARGLGDTDGDSGDDGDVPAPAEVDGERVGRRTKGAQPGGKRRARKVGDRKSRVSARDHGRAKRARD